MHRHPPASARATYNVTQQGRPVSDSPDSQAASYSTVSYLGDNTVRDFAASGSGTLGARRTAQRRQEAGETGDRRQET